VLAVRRAAANTVDAEQLAALAARTFPLACPPSVSAENIAMFIDANLSVARFADYLIDPARTVLTAHRDDRIVGYTMLVRGVADDADIQRAVKVRPALELSKMYVVPDEHGNGVSAALMQHALALAVDAGVGCVWLGVNQKNQRAQRFYAKHGFAVTGNRAFRLGVHVEHDYVMVRELHPGVRADGASRTCCNQDHD
jgi:ribosomal protein S18 acetylase RimI-like enzyme